MFVKKYRSSYTNDCRYQLNNVSSFIEVDYDILK